MRHHETKQLVNSWLHRIKTILYAKNKKICNSFQFNNEILEVLTEIIFVVQSIFLKCKLGHVIS